MTDGRNSRMIALLSLMIAITAACVATPTQKFDFEHLEGALSYFAAPDDQKLVSISETAAARHLKRHSDRTGYYDPDFTALQITSDLVSREKPPDAEMRAEVTALLSYVKANVALQQDCVDEVRRYLPGSDRPLETVYATWGYDIGVASDLGASLNFAHTHFRSNAEEIWFYCVHELHHAGVISLHPFPLVSAVEDVGSLAALIRYLTFLEGTAVYSAYEMRQQFGALDADEDYAALQNNARMNAISNRYAELLDELATRDPAEPLGDADWAIIDEMSGGERLWYRHGAKMAMRIDAALGREGFHSVVAAGPKQYFDVYNQLSHGE